jgi:hypothetical protein
MAVTRELGVITLAHLPCPTDWAVCRPRPSPDDETRLFEARRLATVPRPRSNELLATDADGHVYLLLHRLGWDWQKPTGHARERDERAICRARLSAISSVTPGGMDSHVSFCCSVAGLGRSRIWGAKNRLTRGPQANRLQALSSQGLTLRFARVSLPSDTGPGA